MRSDWELATVYAMERWPDTYRVLRAARCNACLYAPLVRQLGLRLAHQHDQPACYRVTLFERFGPVHFVKVENGMASVHCHASHIGCYAGT